jgi:biopolymer transport protein ExbB
MGRPFARLGGTPAGTLRAAVVVLGVLLPAASLQAEAPGTSAPVTSTAAPSAPSSTPSTAAPDATETPGPAVPPASTSDQLQTAGSASLLPRDLSPWGMFMSAHIVVKLVMVLLVLASVITWTIALAKSLELLVAKWRLGVALRKLSQAPSLADAAAQVKPARPLAAPLRASLLELRLSADADDKAGVKERVASRLERIEAAVGRRMTRGTGLLATIGATAPFVGLFGTVWGIMNSFISISKQHTTNLAVVAPGIAEALLATALGLFAAIPAVIIYNMFSRSIGSYRALYADATAEVLRLVSRDLDRQESRPVLPKARAGAGF